MALLGGLAAALAITILVIVALRKGRQHEAIERSHRKALAALDQGSFTSLKGAEELLRLLLQKSPSNQSARSLRAFVLAVLAVEHGNAPDQAQQALDRGGGRDDDLLAGARVLTALAREELGKTQQQGRDRTVRWPRSPYLAYAVGVTALRQGYPGKALRLFESVPQSRATSLILRNKIRALIALGQWRDASKLVAAIPPNERKLPWAILMQAWHTLAQPDSAVTLRSLDGCIQLVADARGTVSARQKRWAHYLLAEAYGRLAKEKDRGEQLAKAQSGGRLGDPALAEAIAAHLLAHNAPKAARLLASDMRRRFPNRLGSALLEAKATLALGEASEALAILNSIPSARETPAILLARSRAALKLNKLPLARQLLSRLRRGQPELIGATLAWAELLTREGMLDEALGALERALKRRPKDVTLILRAARIELRRGKAKDAVTRFEVAVGLRPGDPAIRAELILAYLATGSYKQAETSVETAISVFPNSPLILTSKGTYLMAVGKVRPAIKAFLAALANRKNHPAALVGHATALLTLGQDATDAVTKAVKHTKDRRRLLLGWLSLQRWSARQGDRYRARQQLAAAAKRRDAIGVQAGILLLEYYAKRMDRRGAKRAYQQQRKRHGDLPQIRAALALVHVNQDKNRSAISLLKAAIADARFSRLTATERAEIHARIGQAYWQQGNFSAAASAARKALALWPQCGRALAVRGIVAYETANFRKARDLLKEAVAAQPNLALAHHYLGRAYKSLGERTKGRRHLRRYLQLRPNGPLAKDSRRAL